MPKLRRTTLIMLACVLPQTASAHPWPMPPGLTQVIVTESYYRTTAVFDRDRDEQEIGDGGKFAKRVTRAFVEHGALPQLTLLGKLEYVNQDFGNAFSSSQNQGLADPEIGLRYAFAPKPGRPLRQGLTANLKLPLGRESGTPAIDNHQTDLDLRYSLAATFSRGYWHADVGPRLRFGAPADEFRTDLGLGFNLRPGLLLLAESFITVGLRNQDDSRTAVTSSPNYDLLVQQLSLVGQIGSRSHVQLGGFAHVWGRNTGAGHGALVSVWTAF